jgi:hypothetical protein
MVVLVSQKRPPFVHACWVGLWVGTRVGTAVSPCTQKVMSQSGIRSGAKVSLHSHV